MSHLRPLCLVATLTLAATATAQITYVDANPNTNTTLADASPFVPNPLQDGGDNNWTERGPFANGGSAFESNAPAVTGAEDAPMLRTRIAGLAPGAPYQVYAYFWGAALTITWRGRALVSDTQPAPPLPGWNTIQPVTSSFVPMTALGVGAQTGPGQPALNLAWDAGGFEIDGHFANVVMVQEGNRWLAEIPLGMHFANIFGEIDVYIDDLENQPASNNRTWYDGVGYELAPLPFGNPCGTTTPQIDWPAAPIMGLDVTCNLANATPVSIAVLVVGFSPLPSPFPLAVLGAPNCDLNVPPDLLLLSITDAVGSASQPLNLSGPTATDLFWQWIVLGPPELVATQALQTHFHR